MKRFPWRPGMLTTSGERVLVVNGDRLTCAGFGAPAKDCEPDRQDPATLGALLGAVRKAWNDAGIHLWRSTDIRTGARGWVVVNDYSGTLGRAATEFEALLVAYEAAP